MRFLGTIVACCFESNNSLSVAFVIMGRGFHYYSECFNIIILRRLLRIIRNVQQTVKGNDISIAGVRGIKWTFSVLFQCASN